MIKRLLFSFKKSKILSKIAFEYREKPFDINNFINNTIKNAAQGKTMTKRELYIEELFSLLATDESTLTLLNNYKRNFDDLRKIIKTLELNGGGQIIKGHYIPISSISFLEQLKLILEYWDGENFKIENHDNYNSNLKMTHFLIQSFE